MKQEGGSCEFLYVRGTLDVFILGTSLCFIHGHPGNGPAFTLPYRVTVYDYEKRPCSL